MDPQLRPARDEDADGLIILLRDIFAEYAGCLFVLDELPELRTIASHFARKNGTFWVAEHAGKIVGSVGASSSVSDGCELHKLYVRANFREHGLGSRLCEVAESFARTLGVNNIGLWTDTKFTTAHAFYARRGYVRDGQIRALHDLSNTTEYHYTKAI